MENDWAGDHVIDPEADVKPNVDWLNLRQSVALDKPAAGAKSDHVVASSASESMKRTRETAVADARPGKRKRLSDASTTAKEEDSAKAPGKTSKSLSTSTSVSSHESRAPEKPKPANLAPTRRALTPSDYEIGPNHGLSDDELARKAQKAFQDMRDKYSYIQPPSVAIKLMTSSAYWSERWIEAADQAEYVQAGT